MCHTTISVHADEIERLGLGEIFPEAGDDLVKAAEKLSQGRQIMGNVICPDSGISLDEAFGRAPGAAGCKCS